MTKTDYYFPNVTLLITHYNRSGSLARLLQAFEKENCSFENTVVSDDGSKKEHLDMIKQLKQQYAFKLVLAERNKGLGNNINKGQDAVKTKYTLYVQEDFIPTPIFAEYFKRALDIMNNECKWDMIRFYAYLPYPYLKHYQSGFSEMIFRPWGLKTMKLHYYSDHPHLRKSDFFERFGRYAENLDPRKTEYAKCVSFIQNKGRGLFFNEYKTLFIQENSSAEPSTWTQDYWESSNNIFVSTARNFYRQIKYNYDLNFKKVNH